MPDVPVGPDGDDLIRGDLPALAIPTPPATHFALAKAALLAGKHMLVEKPLTPRSADPIDLAALADREWRIVMAGHLLLFQPAIGFIKDALASGKVGQLHSLHQERLNLGRVRSEENALWSLGVHDVAVLHYLVSQAPERVTAVGQRVLQPTIEDDVHLHLRFPNSVEAHLHASWLWPEKRLRLTFVVLGGMLVYDEAAQSVTLHRKSIASDLATKEDGSGLVFEGHCEPLRLELEHFLACVGDRTRPPSDAASAAEVITVLETASRQLEERWATTSSTSPRT